MPEVTLSDIVIQPFQAEDTRSLEKIAVSARILRYMTWGPPVLVQRGEVLQALSPADPGFAELAPVQYAIRDLSVSFRQRIMPDDLRNIPEDNYTLKHQQKIIGFAAFWDGRYDKGRKESGDITFAFVDPEYREYRKLDFLLQDKFWEYEREVGESREYQRI